MSANRLLEYQVANHEAFYIPEFVTPDEEDYLLRKITETPQQKWKQLANRRLQVWGNSKPDGVLLTQPMPSFLGTYPDIITRLKDRGIFASPPHDAPNHCILNEYLPGQGIMVPQSLIAFHHQTHTSQKPHEDGPVYYPAVATISLGSHSMFHYYKYNPANEHSSNEKEVASVGTGRGIDPTPVLSLLLEPRSLIVSRGPMYASHLHGIRNISEDLISRNDVNRPPLLTDLDVDVANWEMLHGEEIKKVMQEGGLLQRGVRYSLTFRVVERVSSVNPSMIR